MRRLLGLIDPANALKLHRHLLFRICTVSGKGLRVSHRADLYHHGGRKEQVLIGNDVIIDGTIEVYAHGQLEIGDYTFIGRARIYCAKSVVVGRYCLVSDNVTVMDSDLHPIAARRRESIAQSWAKGCFPDVYSDVTARAVRLGDHCWIGFGASILKGASLGEGAIVGAGSVVTKDVPPWTLVAGNPARVIREIPIGER